MGASHSQSSLDQQNDASISITLPPQRVHAGTLIVPTRGSLSERTVPVPSNMNVSKKRMGIIVKQDSLVIEEHESYLIMRLIYSATDRIELNALYTDQADNHTIADLSFLLPATSDDGIQKSEPYQFQFGLSQALLHSSISFCLHLHNRDESLVVVGHYQNKTTSLGGMTYKSGPTEIQLLQLYNAGSCTSSPSSRDANLQKMCAICLSHDVEVGFLPCRHVCVCSGCAKGTLLSSNNHCPICRSTVYGTIKLD